MELEFAHSERSTVGIEWEMALVDADNGEMRQAGPSIIQALESDGKPHPRVHPEFFRNTVELVSKPSHTVSEAADTIAESAAEVRAITNPMRIELISAGTHPFANWSQEKITAKQRYQTVLDRAQMWGRQLLIYGVHTHVGVEDRNKVLPIINSLLHYYPHILSISASSPFFAGHDTGFASMRSQIFQQIPTAGLPHQLNTWAELERYVDDVTKTGVIDNFNEIRWDIRPALHYGTVEIRIADGTSNLFELKAVSALTHCLVEWLSSRYDAGDELPRLPDWYVQENKWRAARYGLDARIIINSQGDQEPIRDALVRLLGELQPIAQRLGCVVDLNGIHEILRIGAGYQRQLGVRDAARAAGATPHESLEAVVQHLIAEMEADRPLPAPAL
jgi:glutamate---cysteine ligase / carboxylate-amine ligase